MEKSDEVVMPASNLSTGVQYFLDQKIGQGFFVSEKVSEADTEFYSIGRFYPIKITDYEREKEYLRFYKFNNLFTIEIKNDKIRMPKRNIRCLYFENRMSTLAFKTEQILLDLTFKKLAQLPLVNTMLNPFSEILRTLDKQHELDLSELFEKRPEKKVMKYIQLLNALELVEVNKNIIMPSNLFLSIKKEVNSKDEILNDVLLGQVLKHGSTYIRQYLKITAIVPYLRWTNAYYQSANEVGENISVDIDGMVSQYKQIYVSSYRKEFDIKKAINQIQNLVSVKILEENEEGVYSGNDAILNALKKRYVVS